MDRAFSLVSELDGHEGRDSAKLEAAYALLDWALVGRADDTEASALIWKTVVMRLRGDAADAEIEWDREKARNPFVYIARAHVWQIGDPAVVRRAGMPGPEPLDMDWARRKFERESLGPPVKEIFIPMPTG